MKIKNYVNDYRVFINTCGNTFQHLADIEYLERRFVSYKVFGYNEDGSDAVFIEENISSTHSDILHIKSNLVYIDSDDVWKDLFMALTREGIINESEKQADL